MYFSICRIDTTQYDLQGIGITAVNPDEDTDLPPSSLSRFHPSCTWFQEYNQCYHDGKGKAAPFNLTYLDVGDEAGIVCNEYGELLLLVNNKCKHVIGKGLPTARPLWGMVHLHGCEIEIKSKYTAGKWQLACNHTEK